MFEGLRETGSLLAKVVESLLDFGFEGILWAIFFGIIFLASLKVWDIFCKNRGVKK